MPDSDDGREPLPPLDAAHILRVAPGMARVAAAAWWRTGKWGVGTYVRTAGRVARATTNGDSVTDLLNDVGHDLREQARRLLGVTQDEAVPEGPTEAEQTRASLRGLGNDLLARSTDVRYEEHAHPAFARILGEMAPDEARILRLLATKGFQPAIDVRSSAPLNVISQLVAPGLTMIGPEAGCRYTERVPAYLNNLYRLGLVWFSREPVPDHMRYQVLEAQPDVVAALKSAGRGRGKTVRRSIRLTPFGVDFCATCIPLTDAEAAALGAQASSASADAAGLREANRAEGPLD
jgi:hypothetical protein